MIGRGFDNDRRATHTHFEVVNTWNSMKCLAYHKQTKSGLHKRSSGLSLNHGQIDWYQAITSKTIRIPPCPPQHSPFIFLSVWLVELQPARSKPVCFVIPAFLVLCLMSERNLNYKPCNELFPALQTCNVCEIPCRLVWGLINERRCRVNIRLRSDHPPGHEANDQTYQTGKAETVYIKQN